jgi:NAD-dependent SIR2 family protein deacetylase
MTEQKRKEFELDVPKEANCQRCGNLVKTSRIFRMRDERRVCDGCYMDLTDGNITGWHPNQIEFSKKGGAR